MLNQVDYMGIQVFSNVEFNFLDRLGEKTRKENLEKYLSFDFPLVVLANGFHAPEYFIKMIKESGHILARLHTKKLLK